MEYENPLASENQQFSNADCCYYDQSTRAFGVDLTNISHLSSVSTKNFSDCYSNCESKSIHNYSQEETQKLFSEEDFFKNNYRKENSNSARPSSINAFKPNDDLILKSMSSSCSFEGNFCKKGSSLSNGEMLIEEDSLKEDASSIGSGKEKFQRLDIKSIVDEVDLEDIDNICSVSLYAKQIFNYLLLNEEKYKTTSNFMANVQNEINSEMRGVLVDWLLEVNESFKHRKTTFFMAVNLVDRILGKVCIPKNKFQLLGLAALFIAAKMEEVYPPKVSDLSDISEKYCSIEEILEMEGEILSAVAFDLNYTSSSTFLARFSKVEKVEGDEQNFAQFLLDLAAAEYECSKFSGSELAAASLLITNKLLKRNNFWPQGLVEMTGYNMDNLKDCAQCVWRAFQGLDKTRWGQYLKKISRLRSYSNLRKYQLFF